MTLLALPLLLSLGFWQLDRAAEKRAYDNLYLERQSQLAVEPPEDLRDFAFGRVRLTGRFDDQQQFLLDNQTSNGRVGYWVISRFIAEDGRSWLINRGWLPASGGRETLPDISVSTDRISIIAVVWPDTGLMPLLAEDTWQPGWPKRVQRLDIERMAALFEATEPIELRLEAGQPEVLLAAPLVMPVGATKHTGYAVQWFGLAGVLSIGYLVYGFRRRSAGAK